MHPVFQFRRILADGRKGGAILRYRHVSYAYGEVAALDDVSFDAREGEIAGLIGENGAGKSTALRLLMGFLTPDRGEVLRPAGRPLAAWPGVFFLAIPQTVPTRAFSQDTHSSPAPLPENPGSFPAFFPKPP